MNQEAFARRYGGIYEHSPWVAERAAGRLDGDADIDAIAACMAACVDEAGDDEKLALIRAHPELAVREAAPLTGASAEEQASAGLDRLSSADVEAFGQLNAAYREKFGFPFVIAVRGRSPREILEAFRRRLDNEPDEEFATALGEIHTIARLRLAALETDA